MLAFREITLLVAGYCNSATQTGYEAVLTGTALKVYSVVNNVATQIGTATTSAATGTLRFTVYGMTLQVYFNSTAFFATPITDGTITGAGAVGLFSGGSSVFISYSVNGS